MTAQRGDIMTCYYEGCTIDEIRAFRELEGESFDFGEGLMDMKNAKYSEDAYYEMCLPEESGYDEYDYEYNYKTYEPESKQKYGLNRYYKKQIDKHRLDKLVNYGWWIVSTRKSYKRRIYFSGRKGTIKHISNKKVRKYKGDIADGAGYRKIYDYWYELF